MKIFHYVNPLEERNIQCESSRNLLRTFPLTGFATGEAGRQQ